MLRELYLHLLRNRSFMELLLRELLLCPAPKPGVPCTSISLLPPQAVVHPAVIYLIDVLNKRSCFNSLFLGILSIFLNGLTFLGDMLSSQAAVRRSSAGWQGADLCLARFRHRSGHPDKIRYEEGVE